MLPQLRRVGKALGAAGAEDSKDEKIQGSMAQSVLLAVRSLVPMLLKSGSQPQGDDGGSSVSHWTFAKGFLFPPGFLVLLGLREVL